MSDGPGMVYFYSPTWPICQSMKPIVDRLEETYGEKLNIVRIDVTKPSGEKQARELGIVGQPNYIFFGSDNEETRRMAGPQTFDVMSQEVKRTLGEWGGGPAIMERRRVLVVAGLALALVAAMGYLAYASWAGSAGDRPTLMYFRADLWAYCKEMTPIVDGFKRQYRGQLNVVYVGLDRTDGKEQAKEYGVVGTPTLLLLDSEGNQVNVLRGSLAPAQIEQAIEDLLAR
jgi:thiol-disulfide isomerase/thioredoxin